MTEKLFTGEVTTLAEYSEIDAGIAELRSLYAGRVYDVTTTAGMKDARVARAEVKRQRVDLEKIRKAIKAPALERARRIDSEAKRITEALLEIEQPLDEMIKTEEQRKENERVAREEAERARVQNIQAEIARIRFDLSEFHPSEAIADRLDWLKSVELGEPFFQEFLSQAAAALDAAVAAAGAALAVAEEREAAEAVEAQRRAQEAVEQAVKQAAIDKANAAEAARLKAEREAQEKAQAEIDAAHKAENDRLAAERTALEAEMAAKRKAQDEEAARLQAQQDAIDKETARLAKEKADQEAKDAADRAEAERLAADGAAWVGLLNESTFPTQGEALEAIHELAEDDPKPGIMRKIRAICEANS